MRQLGDQHADRDIFNIDNKGTVTVINQPVPPRSHSESRLLEQVKNEVKSRLDQSLHNAVLINLGKQSQPEQVKRPWDAEIKIGAKPSEPLPPDIKIEQVFDRSDIAGRLLILGEPGSGKTTILLDLAKALVTRAEADTNHSIPVLLNLSSWKNPKQQIQDWLIEELKSKYGESKHDVKKWLKERQLLPLLDGLDEVKPEHQTACVRAINQFLQGEKHPLYLVVCSRQEEYKKVIRGRWTEENSNPTEDDRSQQEEENEAEEENRLQLNGAIQLQLLTEQQIRQYLISINQIELWQLLQQDVALKQLVRSPLFLSVISFISLNKQFALQDWQELTSTETRLNYLFENYWEAAMKRYLVSPSLLTRGIKSQAYGKHKIPSRKQTRRWLVFLAQQLQKESQTEFLIENLQPSLLSKQQYDSFETHFVLFYSLPILLSLILYSGFESFKETIERLARNNALSGTEIFWNEFSTMLVGSIILVVIFLGVALNGSEEKILQISFFEKLNWSWSTAWQGLIKYFKSTIKFLKYITPFILGELFFFLLLDSSYNAPFDYPIPFTNSTFESYLNPGISIPDCYTFSRFGRSVKFTENNKSYCNFEGTINNICNFINTIIINNIVILIVVVIIALLITAIILIWREQRERKKWKILSPKIFSTLIYIGIMICLFVLMVIISLLLELIRGISLFSYRTYFFLTNADLKELFNDAFNSILPVILPIILGILFIYFLIAITYGAIKGFRNQELVNKIKANQAIWNTLHNFLHLPIILAIIFAFSFVVLRLISWVALILFIHLKEGTYNPLTIVNEIIFSFIDEIVRANLFSRAINLGKFGLTTGLIIGLITSYTLGIKSCIQHVALRYVLYRSNYAPWNYARFLDYCTERLFLQRIGGRYRFIHKLLQDHFAKMEL